jgi:hypothetical protein
MLGVFAMMPFFILLEEGGRTSELPLFFSGFMLFMLIMIFSSFLQMATSGFYIAHIIKNKNGLDILRIILGIGSFYLPYLALPVYYFIYIWPDSYPDWALEKVGPVE